MKPQFKLAIIALFWIGPSIADGLTTEQIETWFKHSGMVIHVLDSKGVSKIGSAYLDFAKAKRQEFRSIDEKRPIYSLNSSEAVEVKLKNSENAYLLKAYTERGRNNSDLVLLLRPQMEQICEIDNPDIKSIKSVLDLDNDGVSEIIAEEVNSGQGSSGGFRYIMQMEGCLGIILRKMEFHKHIGGGYGNVPGTDVEITWEFNDINGDGVLDLDETRKVTEERFGRDNIVTSGLYRYVFKNNSFIRYVDYIREHGNRN